MVVARHFTDEIYENSNIGLDLAEKFLVHPSKDNLVVVTDQEEYLQKIEDITTPSQRLWRLTKEVILKNESIAPGASQIKDMSICAFLGGFILGGIAGTPQYTEHFKRLYATNKYDHKYLADRHFLDSFAVHFTRNGFPLGCRFFFFVFPSTFLFYGSNAYRNKVYMPDLVLGFSLLGCLHRTWLGPRAMLAGSIIGAGFGTIVYGSAKFLEKASGVDISQLRYLQKQKDREDMEMSHRRRMQLQQDESAILYEEGPQALMH